jgi:hypothetical protein
MLATGHSSSKIKCEFKSCVLMATEKNDQPRCIICEQKKNQQQIIEWISRAKICIAHAGSTTCVMCRLQGDLNVARTGSLCLSLSIYLCVHPLIGSHFAQLLNFHYLLTLHFSQFVWQIGVHKQLINELSQKC